MGLRTHAQQAETAAVQLAHKGRGFLGHREHQTEKVIDGFVGHAMSVGPGVILPHEVREELRVRIDHTIEALETYVARTSDHSTSRRQHDTGVVKQVYALREAQQNLLQRHH